MTSHAKIKQSEFEVDSNTESDYETGDESTTTSLASSVLNYKYENGRRYHAFRSGAYPMPNDEKEQDRLDMYHHVICILTGGLFHLSPLENPQRILDVGTGTGIWALDIAAEFPSAEVIGTDLSPIQPVWVLPNVSFIVDDAEADWVFPKNHFDFIHMRCLCGAIQDWPKMLKQAYDHVKPGGYLEVVDVRSFYPSCDDKSYSKDTALWRYYDLLNKAATKCGRPLTLETPLVDMVSDAGFETEVTSLKMAMGTWPTDKKHKEVGRWMQLIAQTGFEAYGLALFSREMKMSAEEINELIDSAKREMASKKLHIYGIVDFIVAKKPEKEEEL